MAITLLLKRIDGFHVIIPSSNNVSGSISKVFDLIDKEGARVRGLTAANVEPKLSPGCEVVGLKVSDGDGGVWRVHPCYKVQVQMAVYMNVIHPMETYDMITANNSTGEVVGGKDLDEFQWWDLLWEERNVERLREEKKTHFVDDITTENAKSKQMGSLANNDSGQHPGMGYYKLFIKSGCVGPVNDFKVFLIFNTLIS
ncbi:hypothetical protein Cgig2_028618 [Carnegiea gigantea]|uniref:Uncharacterized protein n=1 Tax=Carnegiea gigantea TaxID=171969 RepID=A0A9Q1K797_9CARY|nr:hypothetical protein Cgig2_028618 [Carnegiea gigantea]